MNNGNYTARRSRGGRKFGRAGGKSAALLLALSLIVSAVVVGSLAFMLAETRPVSNTFSPASVGAEVEEEFDGGVKKNVNVKNTGKFPAYIRVKLVTYRVNDEGEHIGGKTEIPDFTPGEGWSEYDGYYYYTKPVAPDGKPDVPLIGESGIELKTYNDADGGKQVVEALAEAIQSAPEKAVGEAWGVKINENSVEPYKPEGGTQQ